MATIGLSIPSASNIDVSQSTLSGAPLLGCNACHQNQSQRAKRGKKRRRSSSSSGPSLLSVSKKYTNSYQTGLHFPNKPNNAMKGFKSGGVKQESQVHAYSEVQNQFAKLLASALNNPHGLQLQCCITYSKPCGCIRKFILGGDKWKEMENPHLHLKHGGEIDPAAISETDKNLLRHAELQRAAELMNIYDTAQELKKEKCYAFNNVEVEGKTLKELRGMIGLGNGRKRSKKYEDYVLQMRSVLRNQYSLCEKAAQKLLGYSINFLYKKLRTNPQKTSRLVATNKAERASKAPRHLIPLEELREMGRKSNSSNQCCGRNCISRLASQHFEKIEDWRRRLEGSGQRDAQEIVAEVLRASSTSLDGQSSFCQNLVHWVTGCSFKKIRRVRDHLKKDPQSLPEHGLKKYWKDKAKKQGKPEPTTTRKRVFKKERDEAETESVSAMYYGMYGNNISGIPVQPQTHVIPQQYNGVPSTMYANGTPPRLTHFNQPGSSETRDSTSSTQWSGTNLNNSNNMMMPRGAGFGVEMGENPPIFGLVGAFMPGNYQHTLQQEDKNRGTPDPGHMANSSCQFQNVTQARMPQHTTQSRTFVPHEPMDQAQQYSHGINRVGHVMTGQQQQGLAVEQPSRTATTSPYNTANMHNTTATNQQFSNHAQYPSANMKTQMADSGTMAQVAGHGGMPRSSVIIHTAGPQHQQAPQQEPPPYSQAAMNPGRPDNTEAYNANQLNSTAQNDMAFNSNAMYPQQYYIAAPHNGYDGANFFQGGMAQSLTPFVLSQSDMDRENNADDKHNDGYGYPRQPVYIFSPIPGPGEKGITPSDLQNWKQMPLTPIHIVTTPYLSRGQDQGGEQGNGDETWHNEPQRFLFPMPFQNADGFPNADYEGTDANQGGKTMGQDNTMYVPTAALTPLAVVQHKGGSSFVNFGAPWAGPNQTEGGDSHQEATEARPGYDMPQWQQALPVFKLQQYPPNVSLDQIQNHPAYEIQQQIPSQNHPVQEGAPQPAVTQQKQPFVNADQWSADGKEKKNLFANNAQPPPATTQTASYPVAQAMYLPGQLPSQGKDIMMVTSEMDTQDENAEEKEGGGIVTPKIIREALSNKFMAPAPTVIEAPKDQSTSDVPTLAPISSKKTGGSEEKRLPPPTLEMPKLAPISGGSAGNKANDGKSQSETDAESQCASISTRAKRFSRDRLRATIDSPNIVLTPITPLTPSITPAIVIPDSGEDKNSEGKEDGENSGSSTTSQHKDGSVFLFPPMHVSRRRAAIRLQGQTVSDMKRFKSKGPADSPGTPGPFPVAADASSPSNVSTADDSGVSSNGSLAAKKDHNDVSGDGKTQAKPTDRNKSPALTLRNLSQSSGASDNLLKDKHPVLSLDAASWPDDTTMASPNDDTALNTPTQQLNTPTSQLNTPTQQLNTPNQDLKTPTESPIKSLQPVSAKRKDASPTSPDDPMSLTDDSFSSASKSSNSSNPSSKSLRFHFFTPKDFNEGVNCSAFRKPSEFASAPTDSAIAQRRRRPRKQANPSAVGGSEEEKSQDVVMEEVLSPDEVSEIPEDSKKENEDAAAAQDEEMEVTITPSTSNSTNQPTKQAKPSSSKPSFPGFTRMMGPDGSNIMIVNNPYDLQTPSLFQLVTPSFPNSAGSANQPAILPQNPFSSQQVNTPVFLHSGAFLTPGGSGMVRRLSPSSGGTAASSGHPPQIFTFMPPGMFTPPMMMPPKGDKKETPAKKDEAEKSSEGDKTQDTTTSEKAGPSGSKENAEDKEKTDESQKKNLSDKQRMKRSSMTLALSDSVVPPSPLPTFTGKESGLQTPSNLKVVTPSFTHGGSVSQSDSQQIFNFPTSGAPTVFQVPTPGSRSAPRGTYMLCTPSKASPTGTRFLYQPCTSPSMASGPMALIPVEMLSGSPKKMMRLDKSPGDREKDSPSKSIESPTRKKHDEGKSKDPTSAVPVIIVEPPKDDSAKNKPGLEKEANKDMNSRESSPQDRNRPSDKVAESSPQKSDSKSTKGSPSPQDSVKNAPRSPTKRKKSTGSPKEYPKPLNMIHMNMDSSNPQVQTPTMIHLISPSQHSPSSPSLVFYPLPRQLHSSGPPGSKVHSPLSAGSSTGGTPLMGVLQRFGGPTSSSSLLKSALMKNLPVFQFPPPQPSSSAGASPGPESDVSPGPSAGGSMAHALPPIKSSSPSSTVCSNKPISTPPSTEGVSTAVTPSAAVSVICGPRVSTPQYSDKLSGPNDPCLSEAAQE